MKKFNLLICLLLASSSFCVAGESPIQKIETVHAPAALGAYSQALRVNLEETKELIFVCGQVAINPKTGKMVETNIEDARTKH